MVKWSENLNKLSGSRFKPKQDHSLYVSFSMEHCPYRLQYWLFQEGTWLYILRPWSCITTELHIIGINLTYRLSFKGHNLTTVYWKFQVSPYKQAWDLILQKTKKHRFKIYMLYFASTACFFSDWKLFRKMMMWILTWNYQLTFLTVIVLMSYMFHVISI